MDGDAEIGLGDCCPDCGSKERIARGAEVRTAITGRLINALEVLCMQCGKVLDYIG